MFNPFGIPTFPFQTSMAASCHKELQLRQHFGEWIRNDIQYSSVQNYELTYAHFVRFPSWEISPPGSSPGKKKKSSRRSSRRSRRNIRKSRRNNIKNSSQFLDSNHCSRASSSSPFLGKRPLRVIDKVIFFALLSEIWRSKISWNCPNRSVWVTTSIKNAIYHGSDTVSPTRYEDHHFPYSALSGNDAEASKKRKQSLDLII